MNIPKRVLAIRGVAGDRGIYDIQISGSGIITGIQRIDAAAVAGRICRVGSMHGIINIGISRGGIFYHGIVQGQEPLIINAAALAVFIADAKSGPFFQAVSQRQVV